METTATSISSKIKFSVAPKHQDTANVQEDDGMTLSSGKVSVGIEYSNVRDIVETLEETRSKGFDFAVCSLANPLFDRDLIQDHATHAQPFTRSDLLLSSSQWSTFVVGKVSPWLDLDSPLEMTRINSKKVLTQELSWATHLSLPSLILPPPRFNSANYSHFINHSLQNLMYMNLWIRIPLLSPTEMYSHDKSKKQELSAHGRRKNYTWEWWNNVRTLCEHHPNLGVALEVTENLPPAAEVANWFGEPVKAVILPTSIFLSNKAGYPTLSKKHQIFVATFFRYKVQFIIKGAPKHKNGLISYMQYINYLYSKQPPFNEQESFEAPYFDYLQAPLQPLMDNLESQTYETFEKDAIKYDKYHEAVYKYMLDQQADKQIVAMVVGAGRGPLVRAILRAAAESHRIVKIFAVEKNPNALVTLRNMKVSLNWGDKVTIVDSDMRVWTAPEKADLIVSELLGSFGDNELSPECLDGVQRFLKDDGVMIPTSYTSYVAPLCSWKLYTEVKNWKDLKHFETAYVVKPHNVNQLAQAQECFTFVHPNKAERIDNNRYKKFVFKVTESSTLHGFVGYFETVLYKDTILSINPATQTPNMYSWFPIYFPIREPVYVPMNTEIEAHYWRNCTRTKVWYEWTVTSPDVIPIHNTGGRSYWIGT